MSTMPIKLYPANDTRRLSRDQFRNPTCEYRGTPFWSWNTRIDIEQLKRQILSLKDMGFGGYHIHSRTGLATEYLGDNFMAAVRTCVDFGIENDMLTWLYDEDRWPSGSAGGMVTKDPQFRQMSLLWTKTERATGPDLPQRALLAAFEVVVENDVLNRYKRLSPNPDERDPEADVWYAYAEVAGNSSWFNNQAYVDTLSKPAIERFIAITHERYLSVVGDEFGGRVPAIFTDEPQFASKQAFASPRDTKDLRIPYTQDLFDTYAAIYADRLENHLPELFWELPHGDTSKTRYRFHDHIAERFAGAFADTIGDWCASHSIALTGHMMAEETLYSQTNCLGEAMRSYRSFHIPGIDMLCDHHEYNTAKQAQSAAHQFGRPGVLSELYGVTNWDFDFAGHKAQGDWQAALGVTVRVPHLAWVSMLGEAKRDYPAPIGYQSPWHGEYRMVEDHFARLNTVLTRGTPRVRVAVIHPIESYWLCYGPSTQTSLEREEREEQFKNLTEWLLHGLIDFDFVAESLLPQLCPLQIGTEFHVGEMAYDVVVVPGMKTIRGSTMIRLERFNHAGGHIVFAGEIPSLVDGEESNRAQRLAQQSETVTFTRRGVLNSVEAYRDVDARAANGLRPNSLLYQCRVDSDTRSVFICNTDKFNGIDNVRLSFRGEWTISQLDTFTGEMQPIPSSIALKPIVHPHVDRLPQDRAIFELTNELWTEFTWNFAAHGHLLVSLDYGHFRTEVENTAPSFDYVDALTGPVSVTLSEPNVLLLDMAEWKVQRTTGEFTGAETWQHQEEILRIGRKLRKLLELDGAGGHAAQPWVDTEPTPTLANVWLAYTINSTAAVSGAKLALENVAGTEIMFDGEPVAPNVVGWWVDESIETIALPSFGPGRHELILKVAVNRKTSLEAVYVLGEFGVSFAGQTATIEEAVKELAFGDWTSQGLPFYGGNVTYDIPFDLVGGGYSVKIPHFKSPVLAAAIDGQVIGKIAFAPYRLPMGALAPGQKTLAITAYGNRFNTFGQLHLVSPSHTWFGPDSWRSVGDKWAYEYQLKPMGILTSPVVERLVEAPGSM